MAKEWWDEAPVVEDSEDWWKDAPLADAPPAKRTWGEAAEDTGRGIMSGAAGLVKSGGDLYGLATGDMNNAASDLGRNAQDYWQSGESQALKDKKAARKAAIDAQEGIGGKTWEALKGTVTDPALAADAVATNIATLIPGMAVGRLASGAKFAAGVNAASKVGPANIPAIASAAGSFGTKAAIGAGAVQQGADVAGDVYESAMKKPDAAWAENPEFNQLVQASDGSKEAIQAIKHELALKAARITLPAASAISVAANAIPGASMLERTLVGGAARETLEQGAKLAIPKAMAKGALGEMAQEGIEEGGGAFSGNVAKRGYVDPTQDLREGVGENAGMGMAGGFLLGGAGGMGHRAAPKPADVMKAGSVDEAIAVAAASVQSAPSNAIQDAGRAWQDLGVSQSGETSSIAARQAGQAWQGIAPEQSGNLDTQRAAIEQAGAQASAARDSRLADIGQQWQNLGITQPQDDLQAQRAGMRPTQDGATDGIPRVPAASSVDAGPIAAESVGNGTVDGERVGTDAQGLGNSPVVEPGQLPVQTPAGPLTFPFVKNESGTVLVSGNPTEIRAAFPGLSGAAKFTDGKPSGVLYGTSAAPTILAKLETPIVQNTPLPAAGTETQEAAASEARAPVAGDAAGTNGVPGAGTGAKVQPAGLDQRLVPKSKRVALENNDLVPQGKRVTTTGQAVAPVVTLGSEVSRYTGKFGKGMGKDAARLEAQRLNRTADGITYTAEEHDDPKLENPYAVVGRKVETPKAAKSKAAEQKQPVALVEPETKATETVAKESPVTAKEEAPKVDDVATEKVADEKEAPAQSEQTESRNQETQSPSESAEDAGQQKSSETQKTAQPRQDTDALGQSEQSQNTLPSEDGTPIEQAKQEPDTGSDIPPRYFKKVRVDHAVWIEDERVYETTKVSAKDALASIKDDLENYKKLLNCMKG